MKRPKFKNALSEAAWILRTKKGTEQQLKDAAALMHEAQRSKFTKRQWHGFSSKGGVKLWSKLTPGQRVMEMRRRRKLGIARKRAEALKALAAADVRVKAQALYGEE